MAEDVVLRGPYRRLLAIVVVVKGRNTTPRSLTQATFILVLFLSVVDAKGLQLYIKKFMELSLSLLLFKRILSDNELFTLNRFYRL